MQAHAIPLNPQTLAALLGDALATPPERTFRPARVGEVRLLMEGAGYAPAIGDIVTLREGLSAGVKYPKVGERVFVTQVFAPVHDSQHGLSSAAAGDPRNIAVAMVFEHECEEPDCNKEQLVEFLHDSRIFEKVGHIDELQSQHPGTDDGLPF